jgi:hypothetical protein
MAEKKNSLLLRLGNATRIGRKIIVILTQFWQHIHDFNLQNLRSCPCPDVCLLGEAGHLGVFYFSSPNKS